MKHNDFIFLSETKLPYMGNMPRIKKIQLFIDPEIKQRHRGGVVVT